MTTLPFKLAKSTRRRPSYLLAPSKASLPGRLIAKRPRQRDLRNMAAGSDQVVAAARSFSAISSSTRCSFRPVRDADIRDLLFIDYWNSVDGLMSFFPTSRCRRAAQWCSRAANPWSGLPRPACRGSICRRRSAATSAMSGWSARSDRLARRGFEQRLGEATRKSPRQRQAALGLMTTQNGFFRGCYDQAQFSSRWRSASTSGSMPRACRRSTPTPTR